MTAPLTESRLVGSQINVRRHPVVVLCIAYLIALAPTYLALAQGPWNTEQEGHGPFIIAAALYLAWRRNAEIRATPAAPAPVAGWAALLIGIVFLIIGRSQNLMSVETSAQIPIIVGLILLVSGWRMVRILAAPLILLIFTIPPPGWLMDALTLPLKAHLSNLVADILYRAGYPIAQNGVMLTIGPYELLVKDACAGLNSLFSLSAISIFYIVVVSHRSAWHSAALYACVIPVSIVANAIRVLLLVLGTYYLGDEASRGLFHDVTGVLLFTLALITIFLLDTVLGGLIAVRRLVAPRSAA